MAGVLDGKVAIVTGASAGIGKGEALALAKEGAKVAVLARTFERVVATAAEIDALGASALALQCDVRDVSRSTPRSPRSSSGGGRSTSW